MVKILVTSCELLKSLDSLKHRLFRRQIQHGSFIIDFENNYFNWTLLFVSVKRHWRFRRLGRC